MSNNQKGSGKKDMADPQEKRKHDRYDMEVEVYFHVTYDVRTKVEYHVLKEKETGKPFKKYNALTKNVSAGGICISSEKKLNQGDNIHLEVSPPGSKKPIHMDGEVRWSSVSTTKEERNDLFDSGIELISIDGEAVDKSIYYDEDYKIAWSSVLESILGNFRVFAQNRNKPQPK